MIKLKEWIVLITFVTIMSAVFLCLVPSGKLKSAFSVLCGIIIIYAAVSPFVGLDIEDVDFDAFFVTDEEVSESYSSLGENAALLAAQDSIDDAVEAILKKAGFQFEKVETQCRMQNGEIVLTEIVIYCAFDESEKEKALNLLEDFKSESTQIIFVSGEKNEQRKAQG